MKKNNLIIAFLIFTVALFAQQPNQEQLERQARADVREGNKQYNQLKFADAEVAYKKALSKNPNYSKAAYNLGNAIYQQGRNKEAIANYELSVKATKEKPNKAQIYHNIGNSYMKEKQYAQAVEAYKNSLRNNPNDDETRYNLALAQKMLKDQQNNQNNDDKNNKDNKDNKDKNNKENQDKDGGNKDNQDKNNDKKDDKGDDKNQNKQNPEKKDQPQPRPNQLSPEQMKQLLDAMNNEENKTQQKLNEQKAKGRKIKQEKDW
jgi:tetratricopeptide (TPR) repeat protein